MYVDNCHNPEYSDMNYDLSLKLFYKICPVLCLYYMHFPHKIFHCRYWGKKSKLQQDPIKCNHGAKEPSHSPTCTDYTYSNGSASCNWSCFIAILTILHPPWLCRLLNSKSSHLSF